jgi:predicted nucleic acid-binding protein
MSDITFDTGALIALERNRQRIATLFRYARLERRPITVPSAVIAEWWRGSTDRRRDILASVDIEPLDEELARVSGEALAAVKPATVVDAIVMASAARRGDVVYTSDVEDLTRLQRFFPGVRVFGV